MFFYNPKFNFFFIDTPLSVQGIPLNIRNYIHSGEKATVKPNVFNGRTIMPSRFCYSAELKQIVGPKIWDEAYTFGVIRNPFDYVVAMYEFYVDGPVDRIAWSRGIKEPAEALREQYRLRSRGFLNWLTVDEDYNYLHSSPFCGYRFTPQSAWLTETNDIFCFENTTPMLNKIFALTKTTLPSFRAETQKELKEKRAGYFKGSTAATTLVTDSFKADFEILNRNGIT